MVRASGKSAGRRPMRDVIVRIAGNSQDGIQSIGDMLARVSGRSSMDVITFQTFPSTISGGPSVFQLHVGEGRVRTSGDKADILVAFYQHSYEDHVEYLRDGGVLIFDTAHVEPDRSDKRFRYVGIPITERTVEAVGGSGRDKGKNIFLMGLLVRLFRLNRRKALEQIRLRLGSKGAAVLKNARNAFHAGLGYEVGDLDGLFRIRGKMQSQRPQVVMNGNQALALGAICAGVRFGAAYPITPWSSCMEYLRELLPRFGGTFVQSEDELAAVSMAIGAAYADRVAVTGSSGPGISLKSEALSYAVMAEVGLVVIDVMRGGPSTGLPTKVEQSDLNLAIHMGHGDAPRVVLGCSGVRDGFDTMLEAVRIAREYRVPVILLSDQLIATRVAAFEMPDLQGVVRDLAPDLSPLASYLPYEVTESGVGPHAVPGRLIEDGKYPVISGLEHDEAGHPSGSPERHRQMTAKRRRKLLTLARTLPEPVAYGARYGEILLVTWGSTRGPVEEAVDYARAEGFEVASLYLRHLHPLPPGVGEILKRFQHVFVVELNDEGLYGYGQLAGVLRSRFCMDNIRGANKTDGLPFAVQEIIRGTVGAIHAEWDGIEDDEPGAGDAAPASASPGS